MTLKLVKLEPKYRRHLNDMMSQWYATGEKIIPYAIRRLDYRDFDNYLANLDVRDEDGGSLCRTPPSSVWIRSRIFSLAR